MQIMMGATFQGPHKMAKISKGQLIALNDEITLIAVKEERGTLIQNCGFTKNGQHFLSLAEGLFLNRTGLLSLEPICFLEKYCCVIHGVNETNQSMNLFDFGVKNDPIADKGVVFQSGTQSGRISKSTITSMLYCALPNECAFRWLDSRSSDLKNTEEAVFVYIQLPQAYTYFKINSFETPRL